MAVRQECDGTKQVRTTLDDEKSGSLPISRCAARATPFPEKIARKTPSITTVDSSCQVGFFWPVRLADTAYPPGAGDNCRTATSDSVSQVVVCMGELASPQWRGELSKFYHPGQEAMCSFVYS